jgi:hypothetical protein
MTILLGMEQVNIMEVSDPIIIEINEPELTNEELSKFYSQIKERGELPKKLRMIDYKTEVIALVALELSAIEGIVRGDKGFYKKVREAFNEKAELYNVNKNAFPSDDSVRKAFDRIDADWNKLKEQDYKEFRNSNWFKAEDELLIQQSIHEGLFGRRIKQGME